MPLITPDELAAMRGRLLEDVLPVLLDTEGPALATVTRIPRGARHE